MSSFCFFFNFLRISFWSNLLMIFKRKGIELWLLCCKFKIVNFLILLYIFLWGDVNVVGDLLFLRWNWRISMFFNNIICMISSLHFMNIKKFSSCSSLITNILIILINVDIGIRIAIVWGCWSILTFLLKMGCPLLGLSFSGSICCW